MTIKISKPAQERLKEFMPETLEIALDHHRIFSEGTPEDFADYKKQQEACKVAIAHILLLLKVEECIEIEDCDRSGMDLEDIRHRMQQAQESIEACEERQQQEQEGG